MLLSYDFSKKSKVRFFSSLPLLEKSLEKETDRILVDRALKISFAQPHKQLLAGEDCKRWGELERILLWLSESHFDREKNLGVVGGGASLDLGAMAASLYKRGTGLIFVPTTLLAMVDATIGGKTAVDLEMKNGRLIKNFAGTFYPADEIWIYPKFLGSLPRKERVSGVGELLKTLWLGGLKPDKNGILEFVETGKVTSLIVRYIKFCLSYKKQVVQRDPLDQLGDREQLNYGHTIGHALESLADGRLTHGESILWGMAVESGLLGKKENSMGGLVESYLDSFGLPIPKEFFYPEKDWMRILSKDKKSKNGKISLTILESPGKMRRISRAPVDLAKTLRSFLQSFRP